MEHQEIQEGGFGMPPQPPRGAKPIPESVTEPIARELYAATVGARVALKELAAEIKRAWLSSETMVDIGLVDREVPANLELVYRAIEDASLRCGKTLQAIDGGVSVYDRATTVGA